ncbi:hypothetical protein VNO77_18042 [Canavalia gladiata]|uniref:Uncharacterized protein n=1 Tax=Canavalia gladiata TaxID=3824 RepID=A0AAN9LKT6_CANGL
MDIIMQNLWRNTKDFCLNSVYIIIIKFKASNLYSYISKRSQRLSPSPSPSPVVSPCPSFPLPHALYLFRSIAFSPSDDLRFDPCSLILLMVSMLAPCYSFLSISISICACDASICSDRCVHWFWYSLL